MSAPVALRDLATQINGHHEAARAALRSSLEHAHEAGRLLTEAKALLARGEWSSWLAGNFRGSDRTARLYMRLSRHREELPENGNALPIREAARLLSTPRGDSDAAELRVAIEERCRLVASFQSDIQAELDALTDGPLPLEGKLRALDVFATESETSRRLRAVQVRADKAADAVFAWLSTKLEVPTAELRSWAPEQWGYIADAARARMEELSAAGAVR